jgi:hypothetical protein
MPLDVDEVEGAVLLVERGECSFLSKTLKAQQGSALNCIFFIHITSSVFCFVA